MDTDTMNMPRVHQGKNVKRLREMLGVKQEELAIALNTNQQGISRLEQKEEIDDDTLDKIATTLKVPTEAIKNMTDEATYNIIANTFNDSSVANQPCYQCSFNPIDKIVELYERLLTAEREKQK